MEWFQEVSDQLYRSWLYLTHGRTFAIVLGALFAIVAIALLVLSRTKWGKAKPLTKFVVVSVLLHVWLLMYAVGYRDILPQGDRDGVKNGPQERVMSVTLAPTEPIPADQQQAEPTESFSPLESITPTNQLEMPDLVAELEEIQAEELPDPLAEFQPMTMPDLPPAPESMVEPAQRQDFVQTQEATSTLPPPESDGRELMQAAVFTESRPQPPRQESRAEAREEIRSRTAETRLPEEYQLRQAPNRLQIARAYGADEDSEAAVQAGLRWLAEAQSREGGWNAAAYGAGTETRALNKDRYGTGRDADTGVTGLAMLAFLSAGHTHLDGEYRATVRNGLSFLLQSQMPSGDMSGPKQVGNSHAIQNSRMYCHAIATLALAEAYAMTKDDVLREALLNAAQYTISAQDVHGGGWRYVPGTPGDLSQFGWQAMALKSVSRSGIRVPIQVDRRMQRFLDSCAAGQYGGLSRYMPKEGHPSETMTAEGLACRLLLGYPLSSQAEREAKVMIMENRPGVGRDNVYFWYYATLALFQLQDDDWTVWNRAIKQRLLETQRPPYDSEAGSWMPDKMWGGYGGRVYSTAMSCLCLEVYYRYLPMYQGGNVAGRRDAIPR
ncbi:MAG: hypothetical protein ACE361_02950 [Aureliella sp.]